MQSNKFSKYHFVCGVMRLSALVLISSVITFADSTDPMQGLVASLSVSKAEMEAGESITVSVNVKRPPRSLHLRWSATAGQCEPQESNNSWTASFKAPKQLPDGKVLVITIKVEYFVEGKPKGEKTVSVTVKPNKTVAVTNPSPAASTTKPSPPSVSNTSATIPPVAATNEGKPTIKITQLPPYSLGGPDGMYKIAGQVTGATASGYRIILYAQTDVWYIQPFDTGNLRFTDIESDGSFSTQTHGGTTYAALLVSNSFTNPPARTSELPQGKDVLAVDIIKGDKKVR